MPNELVPAVRPHGWSGSVGKFLKVGEAIILSELVAAFPSASPEQASAWKHSITTLRTALEMTVATNLAAASGSIILEYQLPMEARRPDVVLLLPDVVLVLEFKGKTRPTDPDVDQAHAYARDLRSYHSLCAETDVVPILVLNGATDFWSNTRGVTVVGRIALQDAVIDAVRDKVKPAPSLEEFLAEDAYRPLPTLVHAARELFEKGTLRRIRRASAATDATAQAASAIIHQAAATSTRRLILISGVPGAGKTLVGLRLVHEHFVDDLKVERTGGLPTSPAVFLSGNGPLVQVLQHELRAPGGGGRVFVRGVKDYVARYERNAALVPPEHVLVFDEAQRAYDAAMVAEKHKTDPSQSKSEPEHFIEFANRIPRWCVVVGLIGGGQEIHKGEEAGLRQWADAIEKVSNHAEWVVHTPPQLGASFANLNHRIEPALTLDVSLRSHLASDLHAFVAGLVSKSPYPPAELRKLALKLEEDGHDLHVTQDLELSKAYLRSRYADDPGARFGILASSRDRTLNRFGIPNDFQATKRVNFGPWYGDDEDEQGGQSCRRLTSCVTEFGAQGLELDAALVAWGTDFRLKDRSWSIEQMARYQNRGAPVLDPWQLRSNAYRVLLTRARDASVIYVPELPELRETFDYLCSAGFRLLR